MYEHTSVIDIELGIFSLLGKCVNHCTMELCLYYYYYKCFVIVFQCFLAFFNVVFLQWVLGEIQYVRIFFNLLNVNVLFNLNYPHCRGDTMGRCALPIFLLRHCFRCYSQTFSFFLAVQGSFFSQHCLHSTQRWNCLHWFRIIFIHWHTTVNMLMCTFLEHNSIFVCALICFIEYKHFYTLEKGKSWSETPALSRPQKHFKMLFEKRQKATNKQAQKKKIDPFQTCRHQQ